MKVRIKLCGLADEPGIEAAVASGADALGLVLAPSPRRVSLARARSLLRLIPTGIERIAVFGRATRAELEEALTLEIDGLEAEADSEWPTLPEHVFALPVLRDGPDLVRRAEAHGAPPGRPGSLRGALLLDGPAGGGRGVPADAVRARELCARQRIVLAGGLTPACVVSRLRAIRPVAVSVSSGVERIPGHKDPALVQAFVNAVRSLEREPADSST